MYIPKHFLIKDKEILYDVIEQYSFATVITTHKDEPCATHLPLIFDREQQTLNGHFAKGNPQWNDIEGQSVLTTFHGPHCYISPSWYETDQTVPTWNYIAVHVYGQLEIVNDNEEIYNRFTELVKKYEKDGSGYSMENVDTNYVEGLTRGVVAFKIHINRIEGQAKLSQNHSKERKELVIKKLLESKEEMNCKIAHYMTRAMNNEW